MVRIRRWATDDIAVLAVMVMAVLVPRPAGAADDLAQSASPVPLSSATRAALEPLGEGVVGEALPAVPIAVPTKLYHLKPGQWEYRIVAGANRGHVEKVKLEHVPADDTDATWQLVTNTGDVQQFKVTRQHEVVKLSQEDAESDRLVVYRPGLVIDPGMRVGESKAVDAKISSYKRKKRDKVEYDGKLTYTTTYLGAYRVKTPAGDFDTRLLQHEYRIKIGPAKSHNVSYSFYADGVGNVAEVARDDVSAVLVYKRKTLTARVLLTLPALDVSSIGSGTAARWLARLGGSSAAALLSSLPAPEEPRLR